MLAGASHVRSSARVGGLSLRELAERALLSRAPVAALVSEQGDILYLHGQTGKFLEPSPGEAVLSIVKMARQGLRQDLTSALQQAMERNELASRANVRVKTNGDYTTINLTVQPLFAQGGVGSSGLFLVSFEEVASIAAPAIEATPAMEPSSLAPSARRMLPRSCGAMLYPA